MTIPIPPGGGFNVDAAALERIASAAKSLGLTFSALHTAVNSAIQEALPVGLGVGVALRSVEPEWSALLAHLSGEVTTAGTNLASNAASYREVDLGVTSAISAIGA